MSARQRHSRVTTSDGWTTISNSSARKKKGSSAAKNAAHSALLAHKSDLSDVKNGGNGKEAAYRDPIDEKELAKVKARLEKQIDGFNSSSGCVGLKSVLGEERLTGVNNVLILALGSISESFKPGPGYQLAAALGIIEALKGDSKNRTPETDGEDAADGTVLESQEKKENKDCISTSKEEKGSQDQMTVLSYDPIYTAIDINLLKLHGITHVPTSEIPSDAEWYKSSVVYMPHASVWLNHKYFMLRPKVWIGNSFDIYEIAVSGDDENGRNGSEVAILLKEVDEVVKAENYVKIIWPEEGWGGGAMFNNLAIYVRKGDSVGGEENDLINGMENISLS
ncbi:hypothetical protein H072_6951 [Dactylellina haptotyla CBS 200.50]|uniref:SRR1-like domain-containing protein n=1 Tax=Dactylellina haptotyla (strain CBS 200.50) TaxID=1284197 RepID=S8A8D0_DACHA|nr:hypothetical protein H072_6951 [Dactylellina haptotyla CBS 200.50]